MTLVRELIGWNPSQIEMKFRNEQSKEIINKKDLVQVLKWMKVGERITLTKVEE